MREVYDNDHSYLFSLTNNFSHKSCHRLMMLHQELLQAKTQGSKIAFNFLQHSNAINSSRNNTFKQLTALILRCKLIKFLLWQLKTLKGCIDIQQKSRKSLAIHSLSILCHERDKSFPDLVEFFTFFVEAIQTGIVNMLSF